MSAITSWERRQDVRDAQREASRTCEAAREARRAAKSRPHDTILRDLAATAERRARLADERAMGVESTDAAREAY